MTDLSKNRLQALIEDARKKLAASQATTPIPAPFVPLVAQTVQDLVNKNAVVETPIIPETGEWTWNPEQQAAIERALKGESFNLIGAAGTGKTTTEKEIAVQLVFQNKIPMIDVSTKYLLTGLPGIVFTSFTRRAVRNSKKVVPAELQPHCITLHKLLEYGPVFYEVWDETEQKMRNTMKFEPGRNNLCKLPATLKTIVIDESSMVSTELFAKLIAALPNPDAVQFIFVGDLHQLPPVYGTAILGFKLLELSTVELTRIYRQAAKSPIISLAHKIKNGETIPVTEKQTIETEQGKVTIHPWKKALSDWDAANTMGIFLKNLVTKGDYNEEEDIILCPQEKVANTAFGTNEFNKIVAQALGEKRKAEVFEIVAGFFKHYYAVGDRLLVGREDAVITKITKNAKYWGTRPRPSSIELDRWGNYKKKVSEETSADDLDIDKYLENFTLAPDKTDEDRKQEASHIIEVELLDSEAIEVLSTAGEINAAQFAYCLTVHKSQGSEWNRVFFLTHQSHVVMWNRELLYTAVTRARKELYCIVEPDRGAKVGTLTKAARSPRIKGDTLKEKAEYFKGKSGDYEDLMEKTRNLPQGQIVEGIYKGETAPAVKLPAPETPKPALPIVRLADFVTEEMRKFYQDEFDRVWNRAEIIWGEEKIGTKPLLDFNLQRGRIIGLAHYGKNICYLNPLWVLLSFDNEKLRKNMLTDTIPHEIAHFINHNYSKPKGKGHDGGWVMAAKLLGMVDPKETTSEYPDWASQYQLLGTVKLQELKDKAAAIGSELNTASDQLPEGENEQ